jgi:tetratricopeptide (TPR) repeat protein
VDCELEAMRVADPAASFAHGTNFRAKVQLKAGRGVPVNPDGTVSLPVEAKNFNYMLNGPCPIYICYDKATDSLWYAWAHDELQRIERESPEWRNQRTVTLKFSHRLTPEELPKVRDRMVEEGTRNREASRDVARTAALTAPSTAVGAKRPEATDPAAAQKILEREGLALVAAGYPRDAILLWERLADAERRLPRMQLVMGYAKYALEDYYSAIGHLREALVRKDELPPDDLHFLHTVLDACELALGLMDKPTYEKRLEERKAQLTGALRLDAEVETLRRSLPGERNPERRGELLEKLRSVVNEVQAAADASPPRKVSSRLVLLEAEGAELLFRLWNERSQAAVDAVRGWAASSNAALKAAESIGNPRLIAESLLVPLRFHVNAVLLGALDSLSRTGTFTPDPAVEAILPQFDDVAERCQNIGLNQKRLYTIALKADFLEMLGRTDEAKKVATAVLAEAEPLKFVDIVDMARGHITGDTLFARFRQQCVQFLGSDRDFEYARLTDGELSAAATEVAAHGGIPPERIPVIVQSLKHDQLAARERIGFCRHLDLLEDRQQTAFPQTAYMELPRRRCVCNKHGHQTRIITSNGPALINALKLQYCPSCPDRSPKGE